MKQLLIALVAILLMYSIGNCQTNSNDFPVLKGAYLGQKPPGMKPEVFAAGIINPDLHGCPVFTPDGKEAYWNTMGSNNITGSFVKDGKWTRPKELEFFKEISNLGEPCLSTDGNTLFFISETSIGNGQPTKENIWFSKRNQGSNQWEKPQPIDQNINSLDLHWQISVAENGNIYFHSLASGGGDIYMSEYTNDNYSKPIKLPSNINTEYYETTPYISPDESYIIFHRSGFDSTKKGELFICFRRPNGRWTDAISIHAINFDHSNELCPNLSPDGKYLFYISQTNQGNTTFWVDAKIIEELKPIE